MRLAELLKIWRDKKADVTVPDDFAKDAMARIRWSESGHPGPAGFLQGVADWLCTSGMGQAAAIIIGAMIGIVRFAILVEALQN
jgi:hypothetical protein